ncbi:MAG: radical SAM family heme chaperone HemW, partial [Geminicoccaceae bacterium]
AWLERVERSGHGEDAREVVPRSERVIEMLLMGLRLADGVEIARLEAIGGRPLEDAVEKDALARFLADGVLAIEGGRLLASRFGRQRLDAVLSALL